MTRILIFIGVVFTIIAAIHYYLWARLVRDTHLPPPWNTIAAVALAVFALGMPLAMILGRRHATAQPLLIWPAYLWMGLMFLLLVTLAGADALRLVVRLAGRLHEAPPLDPARRTAIARLSASVVAALSGGLGLFAFRAANGHIAVRRVDISLRRLPRAHDGLRLVQISDVHVGPTIGRSFVADVVRSINALAPDIVVITGDLVDGSVDELRDGVEPLADIRARYGVYFVTGNHEYYSGAEAWMAELPRLGVRVLRNERVTIGEGADAFDLAGVDDHSAEGHGGLPSRDALQKALGGRDEARELVLLAHQPRQFTDAAGMGVGLQLSGHTHGGQIWPFGLLVWLSQPFVAGLHRRGDAQIYVSRGTGYWGPPMRLGAPAEVTQLVLRRAA
jgi:uncharacterized protein